LKNDYSLTAATVSAHKMELKLNFENENFLQNIQRIFNEISELFIYYEESERIKSYKIRLY
jgi:hypothetical protein